jgi:hypothetical protein
MAIVRYETNIQQLIDEYERRTPGTKVNMIRLADFLDVSRATLYNWKNADSTDSGNWMDGYDTETLQKFLVGFEKLLNRRLEVAEMIHPHRVELFDERAEYEDAGGAKNSNAASANSPERDMMEETNKTGLTLTGKAPILAAHAAIS